jgi:hypothetical protein
MAITMEDKVGDAGHAVVDAAKKVGHKIAESAEKSADNFNLVSPPMPRGKPGLGNDEPCTEGTTDQVSAKVKQVAEKAVNNVEQVSPPMPRGKPGRDNDELTRPCSNKVYKLPFRLNTMDVYHA